MDIISLFKGVILLVLGGVVTYVVQRLLHKEQSPEPQIYWRLFTPVVFSAKKLSSFNLAIENSGAKDAESLNVLISVPPNAVVENFEIQASEKATRYEYNPPETGNEYKIFSQFFIKT